MNIKRLISTTVAITAFATTGIAAAADAPVVSPQEFIVGTAPVTIPGTGIQKGEWMGSKAVLVFRDVTLEPGQKARVTLRATNDRKLAGLALSEARYVGARANDVKYVGKKQVSVDLRLSKKAPAGETVVTVYALTR